MRASWAAIVVTVVVGDLETVKTEVDVDGGTPVSSDAVVVDCNAFPALVTAPPILKARSRSPKAVMESDEIEGWRRWIEDKTGRAVPEHVLSGDKAGGLRQGDPVVTPLPVSNRRPDWDRSQDQPDPEVHAVEAAFEAASGEDPALAVDSASLH